MSEIIESLEEECMTEDQKVTIVKMFESTEYEYPVIDVIDELKEHGYLSVNDIVLSAIYENILDVSSIEEDGTVYLALGLEGENMWEEFCDNRGTCIEE